MNRTRNAWVWAMAMGAAAGMGGAIVLQPRTAIGADPSRAQGLDSCTISGKLTVEVVLDPSTGPANASAWTGPIKDVDEVTLFDEWAVISKRDLGTDGTLVVPRDKIVFINIGR